MARPGAARQGKARQDQAIMARLGVTWIGWTWLGGAWQRHMIDLMAEDPSPLVVAIWFSMIADLLRHRRARNTPPAQPAR
jgi:hypothetical protein